MRRRLELLSPAKNLECGMAAIDHGADAVYIGASRFGARSAAGNSIEDIRQLCHYAHRFLAKVYVTVNTILFDEELDETRRLLEQLADAGADAVLVQDMALWTLKQGSAKLADLPFHASTQTDNRSAEKVAWLRDIGFSRVVLARELSADEIAAIHREVPDVALEVFVHGALCVSYSGLCYASQHCFHRSANRGECAQFCRMKFDLVDADGTVLSKQRHLLSLKDLNQIDMLETLAAAGATSFKIEGRLKNADYVKNVTAAYSERLNALIASHPDKYERASLGRCRYTFQPSLSRTFHRGYTHYFLTGRTSDIASFDTPKAVGEYVGRVKELRSGSFNVAGTARFANGDGLCFFNEQRELEGFRVNRVESGRIFPQKMPASLRPGMPLYRNQDQEFEKLLSKPSAERKIALRLSLETTPDGLSLTASLASDDHVSVVVSLPTDHQKAEKPQYDNVQRQLTRLGTTPFVCDAVCMASDFSEFVPSSQLAELRRRAVEAMEQHLQSLRSSLVQPTGPTATHHVSATPVSPSASVPPASFYGDRTYLYNISNRLAREFYEQRGVCQPSPAYELRVPAVSQPIMQCRHCLRYSLGACVKNGGQPPRWREPLRLLLGDGRAFRLEFDCRHCQMNVYAENC